MESKNNLKSVFMEIKWVVGKSPPGGGICNKWADSWKPIPDHCARISNWPDDPSGTSKDPGGGGA